MTCVAPSVVARVRRRRHLPPRLGERRTAVRAECEPHIRKEDAQPRSTRPARRTWATSPAPQCSRRRRIQAAVWWMENPPPRQAEHQAEQVSPIDADGSNLSKSSPDDLDYDLIPHVPPPWKENPMRSKSISTPASEARCALRQATNSTAWRTMSCGGASGCSTEAARTARRSNLLRLPNQGPSATNRGRWARSIAGSKCTRNDQRLAPVRSCSIGGRAAARPPWWAPAQRSSSSLERPPPPARGRGGPYDEIGCTKNMNTHQEIP